MNDYQIEATPKQICLELAQRLRKLRKERRLSQSNLAERSGVSLGSIKRFETTGQIALVSLLRLAAIFERLIDFDSVFNASEKTKDIEKLFSNKTRN